MPRQTVIVGTLLNDLDLFLQTDHAAAGDPAPAPVSIERPAPFCR
jgi:hypothetical protein